jgi:hypothetical protein
MLRGPTEYEFESSANVASRQRRGCFNNTCSHGDRGNHSEDRAMTAPIIIVMIAIKTAAMTAAMTATIAMVMVVVVHLEEGAWPW